MAIGSGRFALIGSHSVRRGGEGVGGWGGGGERGEEEGGWGVAWGAQGEGEKESWGEEVRTGRGGPENRGGGEGEGGEGGRGGGGGRGGRRKGGAGGRKKRGAAEKTRREMRFCGHKGHRNGRLAFIEPFMKNSRNPEFHEDLSGLNCRRCRSILQPPCCRRTHLRPSVMPPVRS